MSIICILDDDTYIAPESIAGIKPWVKHETDYYGCTESENRIGSEIYLKSNQVIKIKGKSPGQVFDFLQFKHNQREKDVLNMLRRYLESGPMTLADFEQLIEGRC